jgi:hypothetical protein
MILAFARLRPSSPHPTHSLQSSTSAWAVITCQDSSNRPGFLRPCPRRRADDHKGDHRANRRADHERLRARPQAGRR